MKRTKKNDPREIKKILNPIVYLKPKCKERTSVCVKK